MRWMGNYTKLLRWLAMLMVGSLLASPLLVQAQKVEVQLINNEIFVKEASGAVRQLTRDGVPKENVTASPAMRKVVYNRPWTAYGQEAKPPVFVVLDLETGEVLKEIQVPIWLSRYISTVKWIDERFLMVEGEHINLIVLDVEEGTQTHFLYGSRFALSPDRRKIVFLKGRLPLYGYKPPEYESDEIMLAVVDHGAPAERIRTNSTGRAIYPELRPCGDVEDKRYADLRQRHQVKSELVWDADSRQVAFVEEHQRAFWLVVLALEVKDSEVKAVPRKFKLAEKLAEVMALEWMSDGQVIKVVTQEVAYVVDLERGTVQGRSK